MRALRGGGWWRHGCRAAGRARHSWSWTVLVCESRALRPIRRGISLSSSSTVHLSVRSPAWMLWPAPSRLIWRRGIRFDVGVGERWAWFMSRSHRLRLPHFLTPSLHQIVVFLNIERSRIIRLFGHLASTYRPAQAAAHLARAAHSPRQSSRFRIPSPV